MNPEDVDPKSPILLEHRERLSYLQYLYFWKPDMDKPTDEDKFKDMQLDG